MARESDDAVSDDAVSDPVKAPSAPAATAAPRASRPWGTFDEATEPTAAAAAAVAAGARTALVNDGEHLGGEVAQRPAAVVTSAPGQGSERCDDEAAC